MQKYIKEGLLAPWQYYCMCSIFAFTGTALVGELMLASPGAKDNNTTTRKDRQHFSFATYIS